MEAEAVAAITRASTAAARVGEVDETGAIVRGTGFRAVRKAEGEYVLKFAAAFPSPPVVVAVAQQYAICYQLSSANHHGAVDEIRVKCMSDLLGSAPAPMNTKFSFYASAASA